MNRCRANTTVLRHIFSPLHFASLVVSLGGLTIQATLSPVLAQQEVASPNASMPANQLKQSQSDETVPETPTPTPPLETVPSSPESGTTLPDPTDPPTAPDRLDIEPSPLEPEPPTSNPSPLNPAPDTTPPDSTLSDPDSDLFTPDEAKPVPTPPGLRQSPDTTN